MSRSRGGLEEVLETGGSKAKQAGKSIIGAISDTGKVAASQITGAQNKDTQDIVKSLYKESDGKADQSPKRSSDQGAQHPEDNTPEAIDKKKKLQELRQQLHNEVYYDPLVNPKKPQEEERPAEKVEKEKQEEMIELEEKKKKEPPLLVQKTQQRVEKFPGASG